MEADDLRVRLVEEIRRDELHRGLETEKIIASLMDACAGGAAPDVASLAQGLDDRDRRLLLEVAFENSPEGATWEEAASCLDVLRRRILKQELAAVQRQIESHPASGAGQAEALRELLARKQELRQRLA
jgi:hypothetical protein